MIFLVAIVPWGLCGLHSKERLMPVGLMLTPGLGRLWTENDGSGREKEGVEASEEMQRSRDGVREQPRCICFHFCHCIYSNGSQSGWVPGQIYKAQWTRGERH